MKQNRLTNSYRAILGGLVSVALLSSAACPSGPKKGALTTPILFQLVCEGGQAIREHRKRAEPKVVVERGPVVVLPKDLPCDKAKDLEEPKIRDFQRTGEWTEFYTTGDNLGKKSSVVKYEKNKREGTMQSYSTKGDLISTTEYKEGKKEGPETHYYAGTKDWRIQGQNKDGKKAGTWKIKFDKAGSCISEGPYENGYREGEWTECTKNPDSGKVYVAFKGNYSRGARSGIGSIFLPNGELLGKGMHVVDEECIKKESSESDRQEKCGKRAGAWTLYSPGGKVSGSGEYNPKTGLRSGIWTEYYASGEKWAVGEREHTRKGRWKFYDKSGALMFELDFAGSDVFAVGGVLYKNGRKHSESLPGEQCTERTDRGKTRKICKVEAGGFLSSLAKYDPKTDTFTFRYTMKKGLWAYYGPGGNVVARGSCLNGKRDGTWQTESGTQTYSLGKSPPRCD